MEKMVRLACLEFLERWALEVFPGPEDSMVSLVHLVFLVQRERLVQRVMKVQLDLQDLLDKLATKDLWDLLDL